MDSGEFRWAPVGVVLVTTLTAFRDQDRAKMGQLLFPSCSPQEISICTYMYMYIFRAMLTKLTNLHGDATTMNNSAFCQHERYRMLLRTHSSCVSPHCSNPLIMRAENFQECDCLFLGAVSVDNCVCSCVSRGILH